MAGRRKRETNAIPWLEPVPLNFAPALANEQRFLRTLRKQLKQSLIQQGWSPADLSRCVYVIRMTGQFIVAYRTGNSPVLYIGRGNVGQRVGSHLKNWLYEVHRFGQQVGVEIRICVPRRKKLADFFKHVEADLIDKFRKKHGSVPFFNRRKEIKFARKVQYNQTTEKLLERSIGIGSGNRPRWAIKPTPANKNLATYLKGTDPE